MGNLTVPRINPSARSFLHCGVDYAGSVSVQASSRRGIKFDKAYIALFICLATKAVHLELVGSCSTLSSLAAFSQFCARRGLPQSMYSDNGTTFVGVDRELEAAYQQTIRDPDFLNKTASYQITWHFIPSSAPHFGGLWEVGIRNIKYHIRRVVGSHTLTSEEFTKLLRRIEACLNSRPLAPLSSSADGCEFLTPDHLLIGGNLSVPLEPSILQLNKQRRWQLLR